MSTKSILLSQDTVLLLDALQTRLWFRYGLRVSRRALVEGLARRACEREESAKADRRKPATPARKEAARPVHTQI